MARRARQLLIRPGSTYHMVLTVLSERENEWVKDADIRNDKRISQAPTTHFEDSPAYKLGLYGLTETGKRASRPAPTLKPRKNTHWREAKITKLGLTALKELNAGHVWDADDRCVEVAATEKYRLEQQHKAKEHEMMGSGDPLPGKEKLFWIWDRHAELLKRLVDGPASGSELLEDFPSDSPKMLIRYDMVRKVKLGRTVTYEVTDTGRRAFEVMTTGVPFNTFLNGPDYRPCERVYNTLIDYMDNRWMFRWHNPFGDSDPDKNLHNFVVKLGENYKGGKVPKDVAAKIIEFLKAWQRGPIPTPAMQGKLARLIMLAKSADPDDYGYDQKFEILDLIFRDEQVAKWYPNLADEYLMIKLQKQA